MSGLNVNSRCDPKQVIEQYGGFKKGVANKEEAFGAMNVGGTDLAICLAKDRDKKGKVSGDSGKYIVLKGQQLMKNRSSADGSSVLESSQCKISFKNRRELVKLLQNPELLKKTLRLMEQIDSFKDPGNIAKLQKIAGNRKTPPALRKAIRQKLASISESSAYAATSVKSHRLSHPQDSAGISKGTPNIASDPQAVPIFNETISEQSRQQLESAGLIGTVQELWNTIKFSQLSGKSEEDMEALETKMIQLGCIAQTPGTPEELKEAILESGCAQLDPSVRPLPDSVRLTSSVDPTKLRPEDIEVLESLGQILAYPEGTSPVVQKEISNFFMKVAEWVPELAKSINPSHLKPGDENAIQILYSLANNPSIPPEVKKAIPPRSYIQLGAQPELLRKTLELRASIDSSYLGAGNAADIQKAAKELSAIIKDETAPLELRSVVLKTGCEQLESCSEQLNRSLELLASVTPSNLQGTARQLSAIANDPATPRILKEIILKTGYTQLESHSKLLQNVSQLTASIDPSNLKAGDEETLKQLTDIATGSETPIILQKAIFKFLEPVHKQLSNEVPQLIASIDSTKLKEGDEKTMIKLNFVANNPATSPDLKKEILTKVYEICKKEGARAAACVRGVPEDTLRNTTAEGSFVIVNAKSEEEFQSKLEIYGIQKSSDRDRTDHYVYEAPETPNKDDALNWNTFIFYDPSHQRQTQESDTLLKELITHKNQLKECTSADDLAKIAASAAEITVVLTNRKDDLKHCALVAGVLDQFHVPHEDEGYREYTAKTAGCVQLASWGNLFYRDLGKYLPLYENTLKTTRERLGVGAEPTDAQKQSGIADLTDVQKQAANKA